MLAAAALLTTVLAALALSWPFNDRQSYWHGLLAALAVLGARPGFLAADLERNLDDPDLWALVTRWQNVGSYRRALQGYEAKVVVVPLLSEALDEPSAYEELDGELNEWRPRDLG